MPVLSIGFENKTHTFPLLPFAPLPCRPFAVGVGEFFLYTLFHENSSRDCRPVARRLEGQHRPASAACRCLCCGLCSLVGQTTTGLGAGSVVVVPVAGLHEVLELAAVQTLEGGVEKTEVADDSRGDQENHEENEEGEVENGEANDTTLAQLGLLERVDRRADLATVKRVSKER
jgi:hypothetical protein